MNLNKTLYNIKKSKKGFFNIPLGETIYFDTLKEGIHFIDEWTKNLLSVSHQPLIYNKKYKIKKQSLVFNNELYFNMDRTILGNFYLGDKKGPYMKIYFTE